MMASNKNSLRKQKENYNLSKKSARKFKLINKNISLGKSFVSILDGSFLTRDNLLKQIPFFLYITLLGILYIANSYNAEKTIIDISTTKKQLEELRYEYITAKSNIMFQSKQSEIAYRLASSEIKESTVPPVKLVEKSSK